jgi:CheY-like chemotaxis protein
MKLDWIKLDLCALTEKVCKDLIPLARQNKIRLSGKLPARPVELFAVQSKIEQVLINLITNSLKYNRPGGEIEVRIEPQKDSARVEVRDTGIGIDPSKLEVIFDRFLQLGEGKSKTPGIGLGLSICREIVMLHQGRIWAESEGTEKGSRFIFTLPLDLKKSETKKPTVLVADHDRHTSESLIPLLAKLKFQTLSADDGAEAIAQIISSKKDSAIDLLVVDLSVPVRNGVEVIKAMKKVNPRAPIVVVTGDNTDGKLLTEAMKRSSFTLLKKPFEIEEASRILQSVIGSTIEQDSQEKKE